MCNLESYHLPAAPLSSVSRFALLVAISVALSALVGCMAPRWGGFPRATRADLIWPAPPETARIAFVMEIHRHTDLFEEAGGWRALQRLVAGSPDSTLMRPFALALHPTGGLLVTDPGRGWVHYYDWSRQRYVRIGPQREGGLPSPVGVAALANGNLIISDSRLRTIELFGRTGEYLGVFAPQEQLKRPAGLAFSMARQEVYVVDTADHTIAVFDPQGRFLRRLGARGAEAGQFNFPTHLALTPEGDLVVSDSLNFRVQVLAPDGTPRLSLGLQGDAPGSFSKVKGVACDSGGNVIAVEGLYGAIQFFNRQGMLLLSIGSSGPAPGQFWLPAGLCFDPTQRLLFVADSYNNRVQVFRLLQDGTP